MPGIVEIVGLGRTMISGELQREMDRKCFLIVERILAATVNAPPTLYHHNNRLVASQIH